VTTEELIRLIERDRGFTGGGVRTIGSLSSLAGTTRRTIEEAIQTARLEGTPIITDGGIRVAQTAKECHELVGWLTHRVRSQMDTIAALTSQARLMDAAEAHRPEPMPVDVLFPELAA
jgi:hypothetical protein